jgi:hypothetical protein
MSKKKNDGKPKRVKVSIPADLANAIEAAGGDLDDTVERILRDAVGEATPDRASAKGRIAGFFHDLAGPYVPQLEAVAKEVASKVAKDVATAAAAAAMAAFAAKAAGGDKPGKDDDAGSGGDGAAKPRSAKPAAGGSAAAARGRTGGASAPAGAARSGSDTVAAAERMSGDADGAATRTAAPDAKRSPRNDAGAPPSGAD